MTFPDRVLLVTNRLESDIYKLCRSLHDAEWVQVTNSASLATALRHGRFDLALAQHELTWGDSADTVRTLKTRFPAQHVVVLAARPSVRDVVAAMKAGADDYMTISDGAEERLAAVIDGLGEGRSRRGLSSPAEVRLYDEARQRANELEIVHQVAVATATLVDIDRLIAETTRFIVERIYPDVFGFLLLNEHSGDFMPHSSYHGLPPGGTETTVPLEDSITGRVVRSGQPIIVPDVREEPLYFAIVAETRSEIAVPLQAGDKVIGVINVESRQLHAFSQSDLRFLTTLARQVVTAIERVQLYEDLEEHAAQLSQKVEDRTLELQSERDRMAAILDSAGEGIVLTDCEASILYVNPAMERQTGYSRAECLGKTPRLWKSEETPQTVFSDLWETVLAGEPWHGELINRRKDGSTFDAALTITPLYDQGEVLSGFVGVQADISRLKEVDRLKSQFIANVSHELRTPLTNIRTYVSLLERGRIDHLERYLSVIKNETTRLTRLIQDILDLSRLEGHSGGNVLQRIEIGDVVENVVSAFTMQARRGKVSLADDVPDGLPSVVLDKSQLQQVLSNLVANAIAYTPSGGKVTVRAGTAEREKGQTIWFKVTDNGSGIDEAELPKLFDRFYRGQAAEENGAPGTGLGLSICKEILDKHGGDIEIDSVRGQGSEFTVWWPIGKDQ